MEREAREARERTSIASKARAARAAKTARGRAAGSPRGAKARVARAAPDSRQQARTIAYSLARALRALAGGLSWERLGRIALLGDALEILPKSLPEASREDHQEEQGESGEGRPRIGIASAYCRLVPHSAATRPRRRIKLGASRSHRVARKFLGNPRKNAPGRPGDLPEFKRSRTGESAHAEQEQQQRNRLEIVPNL